MSLEWKRSVPDITEMRITALAWAKYQHICARAVGEISCFFIRQFADKPDLITDLFIPEQECAPAFTRPNMVSLSNLANEIMDNLDLQPWQVLWCWGHTHPQGLGPQPSGHDERTFIEDMGQSTHHFMIILSKSGGPAYCRLRIRDNHFGITRELPLTVVPHPFPDLDTIIDSRVKPLNEYNELDDNNNYSRNQGFFRAGPSDRAGSESHHLGSVTRGGQLILGPGSQGGGSGISLIRGGRARNLLSPNFGSTLTPEELVQEDGDLPDMELILKEFKQELSFASNYYTIWKKNSDPATNKDLKKLQNIFAYQTSSYSRRVINKCLRHLSSRDRAPKPTNQEPAPQEPASATTDYLGD